MAQTCPACVQDCFFSTGRASSERKTCAAGPPLLGTPACLWISQSIFPFLPHNSSNTAAELTARNIVHYSLEIKKTKQSTNIHTYARSAENQKTLGNSSLQHWCLLPVLLVAFRTSIFNNIKVIHWDSYRLYTTAA